MPIAPTGPRSRPLLLSAASKHSRAAITMPADASTAGPPPRSAERMASAGRSCRRNSSWYRETSSNA
jgi:hypothetical protein